MPASSSVMPWEIGEYWDTGHFQNNGAAGGLDLRHYCSQTYSLIVYAQARVVYFHSIVHFLSKKR